MGVTTVYKNTSSPIGSAFFFDDNIGSVSQYFDIPKSLGLDVMYSTDIDGVKEFMSGDIGRSIMFLDMHVEGINDLSVLGTNNVDTGRGDSVGLAIIAGYILRRDRKPHGTCILTGYDMSEDSTQLIDRCRSRGSDIPIFEKRNERTLTEIGKYLKIQTSLLLKQRNMDREKRFIAASKIIDEWSCGNDADKLSIFLCADKPDVQWSAQNAALVRDTRESVDLVISIKMDISTFIDFRDIDSQSAWLREPDAMLGGESPWSIMTGDRQQGLARVAAFLSRIVR